MRAAVVPGFGQPLIIEDRPVPEPGPGQVVVRMEASGLCHTDIHAASGDWPVKPTVPFIPGHEGVGIVTALGAGVTSPAVGTRVAVPWLGYACGTCRYCLTGWETLCEAQRNTGYSVDGCYAEYFLAEAAFATPVPVGIDPRAAAPLTCAGVTTYKAVKVGNVRPGDLVLVSGIGGLGHLALQYAKIFGGTVAAVDITDEKLALAPTSARTSSSTPAPRTPRTCCAGTAAPTSRSAWPSTTGPSPPRTPGCAGADGSSSWRCPRRERCASPSSTRC